jgi:hypothetical protein
MTSSKHSASAAAGTSLPLLLGLEWPTNVISLEPGNSTAASATISPDESQTRPPFLRRHSSGEALQEQVGERVLGVRVQ